MEPVELIDTLDCPRIGQAQVSTIRLMKITALSPYPRCNKMMYLVYRTYQPGNFHSRRLQAGESFVHLARRSKGGVFINSTSGQQVAPIEQDPGIGGKWNAVDVFIIGQTAGFPDGWQKGLRSIDLLDFGWRKWP